MIWYEVPAALRMPLLVLLALTTCLRLIALLEAGELLLDRRALLRLRLHDLSLTLIAAVLSAEAVQAAASVEGGLFLPLPSGIRLVALVPLALFAVWRIFPVEMDHSLQPPLISCVVSLLFLPVLDSLPLLPRVVLWLFAIFWQLLDALRVTGLYRAFANTSITGSAIPRMLSEIDYGLCILNRKGWILETNPAFDRLLHRMGMPQPEHEREIDHFLAIGRESGTLAITSETEGLLIQTGQAYTALQRSRFKSGQRTFIQLTLSDMTKMHQTAKELQNENARLEEANRELISAIAAIRREEAVREREQLCRAAHDDWSQRLAVAGLSADVLLAQDVEPDTAKITAIQTLLSLSSTNGLPEPETGLTAALERLSILYAQLGVSLNITGEASFTGRQEKALVYIIREALANAVRHAYARSVTLRFFAGQQQAGVIIQNIVRDGVSPITVGRGLGDMQSRASQAGGMLRVSRDRYFTVKVIFTKTGDEP